MTRLREWWDDFNIIDHPIIFILMVCVAVTASVLLLVHFDTSTPPQATDGFAYCQKECDTATLKLDSLEVRFVGSGRGYVCHCSVRPESLVGGRIDDGGRL